jgi:hypothetical protein
MTARWATALRTFTTGKLNLIAWWAVEKGKSLTQGNPKHQVLPIGMLIENKSLCTDC